MLRLHSLNTQGDTIVEVLISLAVLGSAFGISYATANHALTMARNSQEHSEALEYLHSQIELVQADSKDTKLYDATFAGHQFCMDPSNDKPVPLGSAPCTVDSIYMLSVTYSPSIRGGVPRDVFTFTVTWPGQANLGQQKEDINYEVHQL